MKRSSTTYHTGLWAEALCRLSLRLRGYRILAQRYRSPMGEIDILAIRGNTIAVIEVKARAHRSDALAAVSPHQWARLHRAAQNFLAHAPHYANHTLRFDVMAVGQGGLPHHIVDAWRPKSW